MVRRKNKHAKIKVLFTWQKKSKYWKIGAKKWKKLVTLSDSTHSHVILCMKSQFWHIKALSLLPFDEGLEKPIDPNSEIEVANTVYEI